VIARLYYYYLDRKTGEGNNHGAVILDDTEFHFSDNAGVEIYLKDGYTAKAEEHDTDVMYVLINYWTDQNANYISIYLTFWSFPYKIGQKVFSAEKTPHL
jgi:hypothetical protein